jgi:hypothetical protein
MHAIILCFFVFFSSFLCGKNVQSVLDFIPYDDRNDLEYLFRHIFLHQDGAYVIFGDKPVSCAAGLITSSWKTTAKEAAQRGKLYRTWKVWLNYKHRFEISKYLLVSEIREFAKSDTKVLFIYVINKDRFIEVIHDNLSLFESLLQSKIFPELILHDLEEEKCTFFSSIQRNEILFGILLGYGSHNASLFSKRSQYSLILNKSKEMRLKSAKVEYHSMMFVNPIQFVMDATHAESLFLKRKYEEHHRLISSIYLEGNILEITLSKLISD